MCHKSNEFNLDVKQGILFVGMQVKPTQISKINNIRACVYEFAFFT